MANPAKDLVGKKFGYLTVTKRAGTTDGRQQCALWECTCDCGNVVTRKSQYLRSRHRQHPRSCGCHHGNDTHKMTNTPLFRVWSGMKRRCKNPGDKDYKNYGARGISVCEEWSKSFKAFWADMHDGYSQGLTLDRVDNSRGYSKDNCRWATAMQQSNNRRSNTLWQTPAGLMTTSQAARHYGIPKDTLIARLGRYGWPLEKALLTPTRKWPSTTSSTAAQETDS